MIEDAEPIVPCLERIVSARRARKCNECGGQIEPGDRYERTTGKSNGEWLFYATCLPCVDGPRSWLSGECGGWVYCCVLEDIREHIAEYREFEPETACELKRHEVGMLWRRALQVDAS